MLVDDKGKARGVQYFDRKTGAEHEVLGKVVIVGASCVDSTRILLNSKSTAYPNGIGNSSDVIGRYLCEQIRLNHVGWMEALAGGPTRNDRGIGGEHIYLRRFNHKAPHKRDYLRGFGVQFWNTGCSDTGAHNGSETIPGFGAVAEEGNQAPPPGLGRDPPVRRVAALRQQPDHRRRRRRQGSLRRAADDDLVRHR